MRKPSAIKMSKPSALKMHKQAKHFSRKPSHSYFRAQISTINFHFQETGKTCFYLIWNFGIILNPAKFVVCSGRPILFLYPTIAFKNEMWIHEKIRKRENGFEWCMLYDWLMNSVQCFYAFSVLKHSNVMICSLIFFNNFSAIFFLVKSINFFACFLFLWTSNTSIITYINNIHVYIYIYV